MRQYLREVLSSYASTFGETDAVRAFRLFLNAHEEWIDRKKNLDGHITGSALVWHEPSGAVLRVFHAKLKRWIFSAGGHVDAGEMPWQASARELREETGIVAAPCYDRGCPVPLILDAHPIPVCLGRSEPAHWHYDMVYLYRVDTRPTIIADPKEVAQYDWVPVDAVMPSTAPVDLRKQMTLYASARTG